MKQHVESWFRISPLFQTNRITANQEPITPPDFNEFIILVSDETNIHEKTVLFYKIKSVTDGAKIRNVQIKFNDTNKKIKEDAVVIKYTRSAQLGIELAEISKSLNINQIKRHYEVSLGRLKHELVDDDVDDDIAFKSGDAIQVQQYNIKRILKNKTVNFFKKYPKIQHSFFNNDNGEEVENTPNSHDEFQSAFEHTYLTDAAINNRLAIPLIISDEFLDSIIESIGLKVNFETFLNDHVQWIKIFYNHNKNDPVSVAITIQAGFIPQKNLFTTKLEMINGNEFVHLYLKLTIKNHNLSFPSFRLSTNKCTVNVSKTLKKNSSNAAAASVINSLTSSLSASTPSTPVTSPSSSEISFSWPSIQREPSNIAFLASQIHFPKQHIDEAHESINVFMDLTNTDHERKLAFEKCRMLCKPESRPKFMVIKDERQLTYQFYDTKLALTLYPLADELVRESIQKQLTQFRNGGDNAKQLKRDFETDRKRKTNMLVTDGTVTTIEPDELLTKFSCNSQAITAICSQFLSQISITLVSKEFSELTDEPAYNTFTCGNSNSGVTYYYKPLGNGRLKIMSSAQKDINISGEITRDNAYEFVNPNPNLPVRRSEYSEISIIFDNNNLEKVECCVLYCGPEFNDNTADKVMEHNISEINTITQDELLIEAAQWFTSQDLDQGQTAIKVFLDVTKPTSERIAAFNEGLKLCLPECEFNFKVDEDSNVVSYNIQSFKLILNKARLEQQEIEKELEKYNNSPQIQIGFSTRSLPEQFLFCTNCRVCSDKEELLQLSPLTNEQLVNINEKRETLNQTRKQEFEKHISSEDLDALSYLRETTHYLMLTALGNKCSETFQKGVITQNPTWNIVVLKKSNCLDVTIETTNDIRSSEPFIQLLKSISNSSYEQQRYKWQEHCGQGGLAFQSIKLSVKISDGKVSFVRADYHYEELLPRYSDNLWLDVLNSQYNEAKPEEGVEASGRPIFYFGAPKSNPAFESSEESISVSSSSNNNHTEDSFQQPLSVSPNTSPASLNTGVENKTDKDGKEHDGNEIGLVFNENYF